MTAAQTSALLAALSAEFSSMRTTVDGLSALVADHARLAAPWDREYVLTEAQAIDALSQRLDALHDIALALSHGGAIDAVLERAPLASLAARLRQSVLGGGADLEGPRAIAGDLVLFD